MHMTMWMEQFQTDSKTTLPEPPPSWAEIARHPDARPLPWTKSTRHPSLMNTCMNLYCKSSWLRLWRRRNVPRFEGQWACSPECMRVLIEQAVERELGDGTPLEPRKHQHRIPLGLLMLSQGWITSEQLQRALDAQRAAGGKERIGVWLMRLSNVSEEQVARALAMQWGCPVFPLANYHPEKVSALIPRVLLDAYGMVPLHSGSSRLAYLAFEDRTDSSVAFAVERMSGIRVEAGVIPASKFSFVRGQIMAAAFPKAQVMEVGAPSAVAKNVTEAIERVRPHQAKLMRVHRYFWLRLWRNPVPSMSATIGGYPGLLPRLHQVEDVLMKMQSEHTSEGQLRPGLEQSSNELWRTA
jgi:hypothetical protein